MHLPKYNLENVLDCFEELGWCWPFITNINFPWFKCICPFVSIACDLGRGRVDTLNQWMWRWKGMNSKKTHQSYWFDEKIKKCCIIILKITRLEIWPRIRPYIIEFYKHPIKKEESSSLWLDKNSLFSISTSVDLMNQQSAVF